MKDRVREAVFNLVGPAVKGKHAIDLFAGTGALAFEALSRGATSATLIEQHFPTAAVIRQNAARLEVTDKTEVVAANVFSWDQKSVADNGRPWLVFFSPPFEFYVDRREEMLSLIGRFVECAPPDSIFVVETDRRFDAGQLPHAEQWDCRTYPPVVVGILRQ